MRGMKEYMEYLYHYTSLETLALILKNRTLCFNNLLNVDDIEEAKTSDMGDFGKYVYVSCWTEDREESIPLWNLYTPDMHGVRIALPKFPFEKYHYKAGESFFTKDTDSYINYNDALLMKHCSIAPDAPVLIKVKYTNDEKNLFPVVKTESYCGATDDFINANTLSEACQKQPKVIYSFGKLGNYKREIWKFQNEWRYKITIVPMGINEYNPPSFETNKEYIRRLEDKANMPVDQRLFLKLDGDALRNLEVLLGPKMTEAEKIMAIALLEKYAPNSSLRESSLRIK